MFSFRNGKTLTDGEDEAEPSKHECNNDIEYHTTDEQR